MMSFCGCCFGLVNPYNKHIRMCFNPMISTYQFSINFNYLKNFLFGSLDVYLGVNLGKFTTKFRNFCSYKKLMKHKHTIIRFNTFSPIFQYLFWNEDETGCFYGALPEKTGTKEGRGEKKFEVIPIVIGKLIIKANR